MNKLYLGRAAAFAAVVLLSVSCTHKKVSSLKTDIAELSDEVELVSGRQDLFNYDYRIEYAVSGASDEVLAKFNATILEAALGSDFMTYPVQTAVEMYRDYRVETFREENNDLLKQLEQVQEEYEDEDFNAWENADLSWDEQISGYFEAEYNGVISYVTYNSYYEGGAHPTGSEISVNFDSATGDVIEEDEFFIPGYVTPLSSMLSAHLPESLDSEDDYEMLFMTDIQPNGNFKVSSLGVTYIYTPYEIGPYALGTINVTIPWEELEGLVAKR